MSRTLTRNRADEEPGRELYFMEGWMEGHRRKREYARASQHGNCKPRRVRAPTTLLPYPGATEVMIASLPKEAVRRRRLFLSAEAKIAAARHPCAPRCKTCTVQPAAIRCSRRRTECPRVGQSRSQTPMPGPCSLQRPLTAADIHRSSIELENTRGCYLHTSTP